MSFQINEMTVPIGSPEKERSDLLANGECEINFELQLSRRRIINALRLAAADDPFSPPLSIYASKWAWNPSNPIQQGRVLEDANCQRGRSGDPILPFSVFAQLHPEFECASSLFAFMLGTASDRCSCCTDPRKRFRRLKLLRRIPGPGDTVAPPLPSWASLDLGRVLLRVRSCNASCRK